MVLSTWGWAVENRGKNAERGAKLVATFWAASRDSQSAGWLDKRLTHKSDVGFN